MATMIMAQAQRDGVTGESSLSVRLETYNASDRIERAEASSPMDSKFDQIRNRGVTRNSAAGVGLSSTTASRDFAGNSERQDYVQASGSESRTFADGSTTGNESLSGVHGRQLGAEEQLSGRAYGYNRVEYDTVGQHAEGFPQLASFINSHDNNAVFRRFGRMSARTLVQLQIELTEIEKRLDDLDQKDASNPTLRPRLAGAENFLGQNDDQRKLREELHKKLCEYFTLLVLESQVRGLGQASPRNHLALLTWMMNEKPLLDGKDRFILYPEDFVSVARQSEKETALGNWIEAHVLSRWPTKLKWILQTERERSRISGEFFEQWSGTRIGVLVRLIAVVLAVCILLIPVMLLFLFPMSRQAMAWLVFAFVLAFCGTMAVVVEARVQEIFIGTAAYAAVLVTLLGNLNIA